MVGTASSFLKFNTDSAMMICSFCNNPTDKLTTHHVIPRFLSISSDEDTMEVCSHCHRHLDQLWHNFLLWGEFTSSHRQWINLAKAKAYRSAYQKRNRERLNAYNRKRDDAIRRASGVPSRPMNIKRRYDDLEIFKKQLSHLYWDRNLSWRDVAVEMKISYSCIIKWVRLLGIPSRPKTISVHLAFERRNLQR